MRELILLRHAHAQAPVVGESDFDRTLSSEGLQEIDAARAWLKDQALLPDRVISSPALRAKNSAELVLAGWGEQAMRLAESVYEATPGELLSLLDDEPPFTRLLMAGHNPGFEQLVALLVDGYSGDFRGLPPCGIAHIALPAEGNLEPGCGRLIAFWSP